MDFDPHLDLNQGHQDAEDDDGSAIALSFKVSNNFDKEPDDLNARIATIGKK
jgi:hypothetical protein